MLFLKFRFRCFRVPIYCNLHKNTKIFIIKRKYLVLKSFKIARQNSVHTTVYMRQKSKGRYVIRSTKANKRASLRIEIFRMKKFIWITQNQSHGRDRLKRSTKKAHAVQQSEW